MFLLSACVWDSDFSCKFGKTTVIIVEEAVGLFFARRWICQAYFYVLFPYRWFIILGTNFVDTCLVLMDPFGFYVRFPCKWFRVIGTELVGSV